MIIGLTGSYGSGKTTVTDMFRTMGERIIDADRIAHEVVEPSLPAYHDIVNEFGKDILRDDGSIDRKKLRTIIFNDPAKRERLNAITHPRIRDVEQSLLEQWKNEPLVIFNVPLLFENNLERLVDTVIVVWLSDDIRFKRVQQRDSVDREMMERILASQLSQDEKCKRADFIIDNSGTLTETFKQVQDIVKKIYAEHSSGKG